MVNFSSLCVIYESAPISEVACISNRYKWLIALEIICLLGSSSFTKRTCASLLMINSLIKANFHVLRGVFFLVLLQLHWSLAALILRSVVLYDMWPDLKKPGFHTHNMKLTFSLKMDYWLNTLSYSTGTAGLALKPRVWFLWQLFLDPV